MLAKLRRATRADKARKTAQAAKASADTAKTVGRGSGLLGKLATGAIAGGAGAAAGAAAAGGGTGQGDGSSTSTTAQARQNNTAPQDDPTIVVPEVDVSELPATAERTDLTVIEETPLDISIDPKPIVENYFDDDYTPIKVTAAAIPAGAEISAISNSIGTMAAQIAALEGLTDAVDEATEENRRTKRANERRRDEADVEEKDVFDQGVEDMLGAAGTGVGAYLSKFLVPGLLLGMSGMANAMAENLEDEDDTIEEMIDNLSWLDGIEETYVQMSVALSTLGISVSKGFSALKAGMAAKGAEFVSKMAATKGAQNLAAGGRGMVQAFAQTNKILSANPVVGPILRSLNTIKSWFTAFAKGIAGPIKAIGGALSKLPQFILNFFKGVLSKPIKYLIIFTAIDSMIDAAMAYMFNTITPAEFHERCKKNINDILGLIGGTWIVTIMFAALGTALGTVVPIFGNLVGGGLGLLFGVLYGEDVYRIIGGDDIVNALYDWMVLGDTSGLKNLGTSIIESGKKDLQNMIDRYAEHFKAMGEYFTGTDRIATQEEIEEKYEDMTLDQIAIAAVEGAGTDENALLYVADQIDSAAELDSINGALLDSKGVTFQELARQELNRNEYTQFMEVLNNSISAEATNIEPTPTYEYAVTDYDGNEIGSFSTPEEAAQFAAANQGIMQNARETISESINTAEEIFDTGLADIDEETFHKVRKLEGLLTGDTEYSDAAKELYGTAVAIANDGDYESVKQAYQTVTGRSLVNDMTEVLDEEGVSLDRIMSASSPEEMVEIAAEEGLSSIIENALPDVSSEIKEKIEQIVPIINAVAGGPQERNMIAGNQSKSQVDSATPSFHTTDHFVDSGFQT